MSATLIERLRAELADVERAIADEEAALEALPAGACRNITRLAALGGRRHALRQRIAHLDDVATVVREELAAFRKALGPYGVGETPDQYA